MEGIAVPKIKHFAFAAGLATMTIWGSAARAEILHTYLLVETKNIDEDKLKAGLGGHLGMCKYVIVGSSGTEEIGISHIFVRLDCQEANDLNALITHIGSGIEGVTRATVLETYRGN